MDRERMLAGTIELYEYFFSALLGAGLSQKQTLIFRYLAHLMLIIPGANIHTLRELLETPDQFKDDIAKLDGTARLFFERQFFDKSFDDTRTQVVRRLWGVISNPTFERIFSARTSKIDFFAAMNSGKIILINTAKDLLKKEGSGIFGRFFIAMIAQAAMERALIPQDKRTPTYVYIDEAQDYFDDNIDHLLEQVRKYQVGIILAHQMLAQLSPKLKASIMANTATKLVGGLSATDAGAMSKEMGCDPSFLQSMRKTPATTSFALFVRNEVPRPIQLKVQLGVVDGIPQMTTDAFATLIERNREQYCVVPPDETDAEKTLEVMTSEPAIIPPPLPPSALRPPSSAPDHRTMQGQLRAMAQAEGFHVSIEYPLTDGKRIDVVLERSDVQVACEISSTTKPPHELGNLRKCLEAGFRRIWSIATNPLQLAAVEVLAKSNLPPEHFRRITFMEFAELEAAFAALPKRNPALEQKTVLGYRVEVRNVAISRALQEQKRKRLDDLLATERVS